MSLIDEYKQLQGWEGHYSWLIRQGSIPSTNIIDRNKAIRIPNCASGVWYVLSNNNGRISLQIEAEAALVKGMMKLIVEIFNDTPMNEIPDKVNILMNLKIHDYLTYSRRSGVNGIINMVSTFASGQMKS